MARQSLMMSQDQRQIQTLAPQLRQSLEMLQVPIMELQALIQKELEQNPTLEEKPRDAPTIDIEPGGATIDDAKELNFKNEFEILSRIDDETYNYFNQSHEPASYGVDAEKRRNYFLESQLQQESLQEHLTDQLKIAGLCDTDRQVGSLIIGSLDDDGFLSQDPDELAASAGVDPARLKDVLSVIQDFDPVGVGALNLKECLLLQLERMGQGETSTAAAMVRQHLEAIGSKRFKEIALALNAPLEDVHHAAKLISTLEPKPGRAFSPEAPTYISPDVRVEKVGDQYVVILNEDQLPDLWVSRHYKDMLKQDGTTADVKTYIRDRIRSGVFLIKSIYQRQQTLRKVAMEIVKVQTEFFDHGVAHLRPLTMFEVAATVGLHETTISRCVANKYMKTPSGIFEMKYFFTPGLKTSDGKVVSNKTVQDMIASLIAEEDSEHPLSDQDIIAKLEAQNVHIARRTVAKYRMALNILPSHLRKTG